MSKQTVELEFGLFSLCFDILILALEFKNSFILLNNSNSLIWFSYFNLGL
jgi:hypothetical protein